MIDRIAPSGNTEIKKSISSKFENQIKQQLNQSQSKESKSVVLPPKGQRKLNGVDDTLRQLPEALTHQKAYEKAINEIIYSFEREKKSELRRRAEQDAKWKKLKDSNANSLGKQAPSDHEINAILLERKKVDEMRETRKRDAILQVMSNFEMKILNISRVCASVIENNLIEDKLAKELLDSVNRTNTLCQETLKHIEDVVNESLEQNKDNENDNKQQEELDKSAETSRQPSGSMLTSIDPIKEENSIPAPTQPTEKQANTAPKALEVSIQPSKEAKYENPVQNQSPLGDQLMIKEGQKLKQTLLQINIPVVDQSVLFTPVVEKAFEFPKEIKDTQQPQVISQDPVTKNEDLKEDIEKSQTDENPSKNSKSIDELKGLADDSQTKINTQRWSHILTNIQVIDTYLKTSSPLKENPIQEDEIEEESSGDEDDEELDKTPSFEALKDDDDTNPPAAENANQVDSVIQPQVDQTTEEKQENPKTEEDTDKLTPLNTNKLTPLPVGLPGETSPDRRQSLFQWISQKVSDHKHSHSRSTSRHSRKGTKKRTQWIPNNYLYYMQPLGAMGAEIPSPKALERIYNQIQEGSVAEIVNTMEELQLLTASECYKILKMKKNKVVEIFVGKEKKDDTISLFGADMEEIIASEMYSEVVDIDINGDPAKIVKAQPRVPTIVRMCIEFIRQNGLETQGIFRITGGASKVRDIRNMCAKAEAVQFPPKVQPQDTATLLKAFLRELKEPIIPERLNKIFIKAGEITNSDTRLELVQNLMAHVPRTNIATLYLLFKLLKEIDQHSEKNSMTASNLAIVIAPNIFRLDDASIENSPTTKSPTVSFSDISSPSEASPKSASGSKRNSSALSIFMKKKLDPKEKMKIHFATVEITKFMIENQDKIWTIPSNAIEYVE